MDAIETLKKLHDDYEISISAISRLCHIDASNVYDHYHGRTKPRRNYYKNLLSGLEHAQYLDSMDKVYQYNKDKISHNEANELI